MDQSEDLKDFLTFIRDKTKDVDEKTHPNVRRIVKDVWTYPLKGYLPWNKISLEDEQTVIFNANQILESIMAVPSLVEGKIYLVLDGYRKELWKRCPGMGKMISGLLRPLQENIETEHITLINSDVVASVPKDKLRDLLARWSDTKFTIKCTGVRHTISLDWARFGVCLVTTLECPKLEEFMNDWNKTFNSSIKISMPHITVAIDSRC